MIRYTCRCNTLFTISNDLEGRKLRCPKCGASGRAPMAGPIPVRLPVPTADELAGVDLDEFLDVVK